MVTKITLVMIIEFAMKDRTVKWKEYTNSIIMGGYYRKKKMGKYKMTKKKMSMKKMFKKKMKNLSNKTN